MNELDDIVRDFLIESNENLDQLDLDLVALEKEPRSQEILSRVFRAIHTIKGTTGFLGFEKLESVTHTGESLLCRLRDGVQILNPAITSGLLAMVDAVREILSNIEATGQEGSGDFTGLVERLKLLQGDVQQAPPAAAVLPIQATADSQPPAPAPIESEAPPEAPSLGQLLVASGRVTPEQVTAAVERQRSGDPRYLGEILVEHGHARAADVAEALKAQTEARGSLVLASNIRVGVAQLDKLMDLVGELVLARNQILQFTSLNHDPAFLRATQRLNLITSELQEGVMKTRLQPIDNIWSRFPRLVHDLAASCGKHVRLDMEGKSTELDRTLIEAIKDPLTHIVRNSVDHGIERPVERLTAGKAVEGRIFLTAYHEGGQVNIEISDDGAGIPVERVKRKAVERGLITSDQATHMSEREALNLIFLPGLSTAEKVTKVSGRGVGMDVVRINLEKINGSIDVQSRPGEGTTLKIKIPLTVAIIPALIVTAAGERYAIPRISLLELIRLEGDEARKGIERTYGAPVYRLHGKLLPLVDLSQELGLKDQASGDVAGGSAINIVVLEAEDRSFGLLVDAVNDTEQIVVKPLGKQLRGIGTFAGATIMGDGKIVLILDVPGIAHRAGVISEVRERAMVKEGSAGPTEQAANRQSLLLFESPDNGRMAVPLGLVARLEEFPRSAVEKVGSREMVQYHDTILPLVRLSALLDERRRTPRRRTEAPPAELPLQVVVYADKERKLGLVVEHVLDIVEEDLARQQPPSRDGVLGTLVVQGRVTEILDLEGLVRAHTALGSSNETLQRV